MPRIVSLQTDFWRSSIRPWSDDDRGSLYNVPGGRPSNNICKSVLNQRCKRRAIHSNEYLRYLNLTRASAIQRALRCYNRRKLKGDVWGISLQPEPQLKNKIIPLEKMEVSNLRNEVNRLNDEVDRLNGEAANNIVIKNPDFRGKCEEEVRRIKNELINKDKVISMLRQDVAALMERSKMDSLDRMETASNLSSSHIGNDKSKEQWGQYKGHSTILSMLLGVDCNNYFCQKPMVEVRGAKGLKEGNFSSWEIYSDERGYRDYAEELQVENEFLHWELEKTKQELAQTKADLRLEREEAEDHVAAFSNALTSADNLYLATVKMSCKLHRIKTRCNRRGRSASGNDTVGYNYDRYFDEGTVVSAPSFTDDNTPSVFRSRFNEANKPVSSWKKIRLEKMPN